jgi:hypothetical protein
MDTLRYLNKNINANERQNFSNWWKEQISIYGSDTLYYSNSATIENFNALYGENFVEAFQVGKPLIVLYILNNDSVMLSKFGIIADSDMTGVIHPQLYEAAFGAGAEPKADDLLVLSEYGSDRLHYPKRGATVYQLTEVIDEYQTNALGGHYVWFIKGKRYDYSHENGSPGPGVGNVQLDDNDKIEEVSSLNFDYEQCLPPGPPELGGTTSVYGEY